VAKYRQRVLTSLKTQETQVYQWVQASSQNELNDLIVKTYIKSGRIWEFMGLLLLHPPMKEPHLLLM